MSTPTVKTGIVMVVRVGGTAVAAQRTGSIKLNADEIDITTKSSAFWKEHLAGFKDWTLETQGLYAVTDTARAALISAWSAGTTVAVDFYDNGTSATIASGTATVKSMDISGNYNEAGMFNATLSGTGVLSVS